jgi:hypothetical protein
MAWQNSVEGLSTEGRQMGRRQVPIDWLDLEMAFETHLDDSASYLDLRDREGALSPDVIVR